MRQEALTDKARAIRAAAAQLLAQGLDPRDITARSIADAAGVGKGTLYEYFSSKEEILAAGAVYRLQEAYDASRRRIEGEQGFERKTRALLEVTAEFAVVACGLGTALFGNEQNRTLYAPYSELFLPLLQQTRVLYAQLIEAARAEGLVNAAHDEAYCLQALISAALGVVNPAVDIYGMCSALHEQKERTISNALTLLHKALG